MAQVYFFVTNNHLTPLDCITDQAKTHTHTHTQTQTNFHYVRQICRRIFPALTTVANPKSLYSEKLSRPPVRNYKWLVVRKADK